VILYSTLHRNLRLQYQCACALIRKSTSHSEDQLSSSNKHNKWMFAGVSECLFIGCHLKNYIEEHCGQVEDIELNILECKV
jgi:hypothetical protein